MLQNSFYLNQVQIKTRTDLKSVRENARRFLAMISKSITRYIVKSQLKLELYLVYKITNLLFNRLNVLELKYLNFDEINATHITDFTRSAVVRRIQQLEKKTYG